MSARHLHRRFRAQTGTTPRRWLLWARTERARELLETTDLPIDQVAEVAGFGSAGSLRAHFRDELGTTPAAYRRSFRHAHPPAAGAMAPRMAGTESAPATARDRRVP
jgi:transcriptional regulator GlxA family with amidase domain